MSVDYGVLNRLVFGARNRRDRTSITVKKTVTESKAAWAGGIRQGSFALFRVWRNAFNVEAAQFPPFDWEEDILAIVETRSCKEMVQNAGFKESPSP